MAQVIVDQQGHEVYVIYWTNTNDEGEPQGSRLYAHGWCNQCDRYVWVVDDTDDLFGEKVAR